MKKNTFVKIAVMGLLSASAALYAESDVKYISPNNDGVQDNLTIPLKISDKHLIKSWSLVIENSDGKIIRTIGNKVALPEKVNAKSFFKQLATPKTGVEVPAAVAWNGAMDNGENAPDGTYYYYFEATDDNGNTGKTKKYTVVVDTQAPEIVLSQPSDKIFGEGAKSELQLKQSGSKEDRWTGTFRNTVGNTVRTLTWDNSEPGSFKWAGTDDVGRFVPDGVYTYEVTATDRAGNKSPSAIVSNIIYSAEKPATNIIIGGSRYFSPETDSQLSTIKFAVTIPVPEANSGNKLTSWSVKIVDSNGSEKRSYDNSKSQNPPSEIYFDGKDDDGKLLPNGKYQAYVRASYLNGYEPALLKSPEFILDVTKPSAQLGVSASIFGGAAKPSVKISMLDDNTGKYAAVPAWHGRIFDSEKGTTVREFNFGQYLPDSISWNGFDANGKLAPDSKYQFELSATDLAGNKGVIVSKDTFTLDTKKASLLLSLSDTAFSPNNDRVKDTIQFLPILKDASGVDTYDLVIKNSKGTEVKTIKGKGTLPASITWDGKNNSGIITGDDTYSATLIVMTTGGNMASIVSPNFVVDTQAPFLTPTTTWSAFSPDGDGIQDTIPVTITGCTSEELWVAEVKDSKNNIVKRYTWKGKVRTDSKDMFEWDGSTESGNKAPDGTYSIVLSSTDAAGNAFSHSLSGFTLDSRETKAYVTAEEEGISPNGDKVVDTQKFNIKTTVQDGILTWNFDICSENGTKVRSWSDKDSSNLPATVIWDGLDSEGNVAEGTFVGALKVTYKKGNVVTVTSSPFICTATPPQLGVRTAPEYFSPDNDGTDDDLFIRLSGTSKAMIKNWSFVIYDPNGKPFWQTKGTSSITERIIWDGLSNTQKNSKGYAERVQSAMDYPYSFTVTDTLGMTSKKEGMISIDVLVIRDGDVLKMAVPSIIFRSDNADFKTTVEVKNGIKPEIAANNERVLKRIAEILNKFKDYRVTVVGHANRLTDLEAEETEDNPKQWGPALIPLSAKRAEFVKDYLVKKGVSSNRLSTEGKGGTELVVDYKDKDNNWKNRRVEFILEK